MSMADIWINNEPDVAVAFQLARAGYDVWLGNNRGNMYSSKHVKLDPVKDAREYFNYSFQDLAEHDLPAQIDKVLEVTEKLKLTYIGHSQGTSQFFYALSTKQQYYSDRVNLFVALAPVVSFKNCNRLMKWSALIEEGFEYALDKEAVYSVFGKDWNREERDWEDSTVAGRIYKEFEDSVLTTDSPHNSEKWIVVGSSWSPARASCKELFHYAQLVKSGLFQKFDFENADRNNKVYGQSTPPRLEFNNVKEVPVAMFCGKEDTLSHWQDCEWLAQQLNCTVHYEELAEFDHSSFNMAKDMSYFQRVLPLLKKFND